MIQLLMEEVRAEADRRTPELIRRVLDHHSIRSQCCHMMMLEWIVGQFAFVENWLVQEACYRHDGTLEHCDEMKFWQFCRDMDQAQEYARLEELACGECDDCREADSFYFTNLVIDMRSLLTSTWREERAKALVQSYLDP